MESQTEHYELRSHPHQEKFLVAVGKEGLEGMGLTSLRYDAIREVNLSYVMATEYDVAHYLCRVWTANGAKLFVRANEGDLGQCPQYQGFVLALHKALLVGNPKVRCTTGMRSKIVYGLIIGVFGLMFAGLILGVILGMAQKGKVALGILLIMGIVVGAVFLFRMLRVMARPGTYDPGAIPGALLPMEG